MLGWDVRRVDLQGNAWCRGDHKECNWCWGREGHVRQGEATGCEAWEIKMGEASCRRGRGADKSEQKWGKGRKGHWEVVVGGEAARDRSVPGKRADAASREGGERKAPPGWGGRSRDRVGGRRPGLRATPGRLGLGKVSGRPGAPD